MAETNFDMAKFTEIMRQASDSMSSAAGAAGAAGYTIGAGIQGYKDGRAGDTSKYRPINDIDVTADVGDNAKSTVKWLVVGVVVAVGIWYFVKRKNQK